MAGKNMFHEIFLVVTKQHRGKGGDTPWKINKTRNGGLEDEFRCQLGDFQIPCFCSGPYEVSGVLLPKYDLLDSLWD